MCGGEAIWKLLCSIHEHTHTLSVYVTWLDAIVLFGRKTGDGHLQNIPD